jgi:hypothetical protein
VEGCGIRDELIIACSNFRPSSSQNSHARRLFVRSSRLDFQS